MEEQRHDYPDILAELKSQGKRIEKIEDQTNGAIKAQFVNLTRFISDWISKHDSDAKEFRIEIRSDIRDLVKVVSERPCIIHTEQINSLMAEKNSLVAFAVVLVGFIIAGLIAWGSLKNQVEVNTHRWEQLMSQGVTIK